MAKLHKPEPIRWAESGKRKRRKAALTNSVLAAVFCLTLGVGLIVTEPETFTKAEAEAALALAERPSEPIASQIQAATEAAKTQAAPQPVADAEPSVRVRVIDGDTIEIRGSGERVRLENIDTPENGDRAHCDAERQASRNATNVARQIFSNANSIQIRRTGRIDKYGRTIAYVTVDGADFGETMISRGVARPWRGHREPWCAAGGGLLP